MQLRDRVLIFYIGGLGLNSQNPAQNGKNKYQKPVSGFFPMGGFAWLCVHVCVCVPYGMCDTSTVE